MESDWDDAAQDQASFCRIFGNSKRVLILWTLVEEERPVSEIAATIGASLQNTSSIFTL
jgi:DNA-binding transcriptional ArsR family regulator